MAGKFLRSLLIAANLLFCSLFFASSALAQDPMIFLPFEAGKVMRVSQGVQQYGQDASHNGSLLQYAYDFTAPRGEVTDGVLVYAPANGDVVELYCSVADDANGNSGWGNTVVLRVLNGYSYVYIRVAHLKYNSCSHLDVGDFVEQGSLLGKIGDTGNSTAPHLHIQVSTRNAQGQEVSVPFNFVERGGVLNREDLVTSRLRRDTVVIDNTGRVNAGVDFVTNPTIAFSGTWTNYTSASNKIIQGGHRKALTPTPSTKAVWQFKVLAAANYRLHVTCLENSTNTVRANYKLEKLGSLVGSVSYEKNQTVAPSDTLVGYRDTYFLGTRTLDPNTYYTLTATRANTSGALCVDALFIMMQ